MATHTVTTCDRCNTRDNRRFTKAFHVVVLQAGLDNTAVTQTRHLDLCNRCGKLLEDFLYTLSNKRFETSRKRKEQTEEN